MWDAERAPLGAPPPPAEAARRTHAPQALPRHRGAAPLQHTLLAGDTATAVSVIEVSKRRFDHGRLLHSRPFAVPPECSYGALAASMAEVGSEALLHTLQELPRLRAAAVPQESTGLAPTLAPKIARTAGRVDPAREPAARLHRMHRAFGHQAPLTCRLAPAGPELQLTALRSELLPLPPAITAAEDCTPAGGLVYDRGSREPPPPFHRPQCPAHPPAPGALYVRCADGWLGVTAIKPTSKTERTAEQFANGYGLRKTPGLLSAPETPAPRAKG